MPKKVKGTDWTTSYSWLPENKPQFYLRYSYYFLWVNTHETPIARYEWAGNTLLLTPAFLKLYSNKETKKYPLRKLSRLSYTHKRLWFPLVAGGIVSPFALALTLSGFAGLWWGVGALILGLLSMFYGWQGNYELELGEIGQLTRFYMPQEDAELLRFIRQVQSEKKKLSLQG